MHKHLGILTAAAFLAALIGLAAGCDGTPQNEYPTEDRLTAGIFLDVEAERAVLPEGVALRKVYDKGVELTKGSEGFRGRLYHDAAGYCTIGYGHLVKTAPCNGNEPSEFRVGISEPRGTQILRRDMASAERGVMLLVDTSLTDGQYAALCDFVFNVGVGNFRSSTLRRRVNARDYERVPFEFRRWVYAGGRKWVGLAKRRENEITLFFEEIGIPRALPPADTDLSPIDIRSGEAGS